MIEASCGGYEQRRALEFAERFFSDVYRKVGLFDRYSHFWQVSDHCGVYAVKSHDISLESDTDLHNEYIIQDQLFGKETM